MEAIIVSHKFYPFLDELQKKHKIYYTISHSNIVIYTSEFDEVQKFFSELNLD